MARTAQLLDHLGRPVRKQDLKEEVSAARVGSARSPLSGHPGEGLDPLRLADILRAADRGDPIRYLELAEAIEEKNAHYLGVLGTRRRSVSQIPITVKAASDAGVDVDIAKEIESWLTRRQLQLELFDILDAIGKGFSFTEIIWDTSMGQWQPARLEYRDPRWFRFDRNDLITPRMLDDLGMEQPLPPFKFVYARMQAKSGLPLRSGLARVAMWGHLFKLYSERDWQVFIQTYGQPVRLGKFGGGATDRDKDILFQAVSNIAGDCAAIIPESMSIDFVENGSLTASSDLYKDRADWLDQQISKAVLGQTATTDAVTGGLGSGKEHREVQEDIETADCVVLEAIINRDLIRPWVQLNYGPQAKYPLIEIGRPEPEDVDALTRAVSRLVPLGFRVGTEELYAKVGLTPPDKDAEILFAPAKPSAAPRAEDVAASLNSENGKIKQRLTQSECAAPELNSSASEGRSTPLDPTDAMTDRMDIEADAAIAGMIGEIQSMLEAAGSLEEFAEMLRSGFPDLDSSQMAVVMTRAMLAAHAAGQVQVAESDG